MTNGLDFQKQYERVITTDATTNDDIEENNMEDLRRNKNRVALMDLGITKHEKTRMLEDGTAQKIFHGNGSHGYRLYTSREIAEQILMQQKHIELDREVARCDETQTQKSI